MLECIDVQNWSRLVDQKGDQILWKEIWSYFNCTSVLVRSLYKETLVLGSVTFCDNCRNFLNNWSESFYRYSEWLSRFSQKCIKSNRSMLITFQFHSKYLNSESICFNLQLDFTVFMPLDPCLIITFVMPQIKAVNASR